MYRLPLAQSWGDQTHRIDHIELVVVDITADTGESGTGFSYSVGVGGRAIAALLEWYVAPKLIGTTVAPRVQWHHMWRELHDAGGGGLSTMAIAACDIAFWDLIGKSRGQSLVELLGRFRESVPAYGSGVNLNLTAAELEEQVRRWIDAGYRGVKVKVGKPDRQEDLDRLAMVRRLIGKDRQLMIDANQGWDLAAATQAINAFEAVGLHWVEEPLLSDDIQGHARLRRQVRTPLAIGENVYTVFQFNEYLAQGACDFVQADPVRVGGISPWLEIASLAATWGTPMAPHFVLELSGQLLCCIPNAHVLEDVEGGSFGELGILAEAIDVNEGRFTPPSRPGHGIIFDRERLGAHRAPAEPPATAERLWQAV
jgi:L-alanine-DL-glutamate epimerase-like enolase superfamily enzyme